MWKTLKKIIPSANIHAAGSRYMLRSASSSVNPSNYIKEGNERSDVFSLVLFANSLKRENQKLSKLCGNTTYSEATKNAYRLQIEANESQLGSYIRQLERDFENQGDLPADALAGFVSLVAGGNVLTQEYLNIHLKADLLSKIEFASLEALTELAEALEILGFDRSSDISSEVHTTLSHRLDTNSGFTNVDYVANSLEQYSESKVNAKQNWYGTVTHTQSSPIQSRLANAISPSIYNHYKHFLLGLILRNGQSRVHEETDAEDVVQRATKIVRGQRSLEQN